MMDSRVFICASATELQRWMKHIEDRRYKSMTQPMSPSHCALSYLVITVCLSVCFQLYGREQSAQAAINKLIILIFLPQLPCDEHWKREELKKYLLHAPIWQWEGSPIQHMGQPGCISMVHIINTQRQVINALSH